MVICINKGTFEPEIRSFKRQVRLFFKMVRLGNIAFQFRTTLVECTVAETGKSGTIT